jgi:CRP-like cAMP-binding protein
MLFLTAGPVLVGIGVLLYLGVIAADFRKRRVVSQMHFAPGETIYRQGDPADHIYAVMTGEVEVLREEEGKETILTRLGPGQYFGQMSFSDAPRITTARTVTPVDVVSLPLAQLTPLLALPDFRRSIRKAMTQNPALTVAKK